MEGTWGQEWEKWVAGQPSGDEGSEGKCHQESRAPEQFANSPGWSEG